MAIANVINFINFIISSVIVFLNYLMFSSLYNYKKIRSKEENLFLEKKLFNAICFTYYMILYIFIALDICSNSRNSILYQIQEYLYNIYIVAIYLINLFMSIEMFFTYKNPIYYYLIIFNKKSRKIYEFIIIIFSLLIIVLKVLLDLNNKNEKDDYYTPFILDNLNWIILLISNIITLVFNFKLLFLISKFDFDKKDKLKKILKRKLLSNFCYFFYAFYNLLSFGFLKENNNKNYTFISIIVGSFIIIIIIVIDTILDLLTYSTTKFSQYKLRSTLIGYLGHIFPNDFEEELDVMENIKLPKTNLNDEEEEEDEEDEEEKEENEAEKSLLPKCPADTELVSIFKNNIFFEDYFMSFCDQYLNVITASLFKMFNSKLFSIKNVENKKIKEEMGGISISGIGGAGNASSTQEISATVEEGDNSSSYTFHKKKGKNHFAIFKHILGTTTTEDLKVKISSYYTDNCVMNIKKLNLASKKIASSIISHFIISAKKDDKDHPNNYWSLTSANAKEEYFRNMRNVSFKSYDKNYNLDFFEADDQKISLNNKSNKNIADMINKYFDYIQKGKGQTGTFLPELIGIFKVKINDFNTMLIFISRNSIVYNVPKNFYTYWQLLRFDNLKPQKIATSKCRGTLVTEESLFERLYESDIKKNKDMNKVMLKNYSDFKEIIGNDINFLKDNNLLNVNLLMMYYEYENTQKHEKEGAIQIRKTDENKAEIINIDLPGNANNEQKNNEKKEKKEKELKQEKKEKELKQEKKENDEDVLNIGEIKDELNNKIIDDFDGEKGEVNDIFGDEEFDFMPDLGKDAHNLLDYTEKVNIAGYEGNFDNFVCMCFFTFENAFDINNRSGTIANEAFKNKILENFSEFKQK